MKKLHSLALAVFLLLVSATAGASSISALDTSGHHGDQVSLDVQLSDGDITSGGDFHIAFDHTKLSLLEQYIGGTDAFVPFFVTDFPSPDLVNLSLAYMPNVSPGDPLPPYPSGAIFSLIFSIIEQVPQNIPVNISWFLVDDVGVETTLSSITPVVKVLAQDVGTVPEPGVLGLLGLAMLLVPFRGRRRPIRNDRV